MATLEKLGGVDELGGPNTENMYSPAWAWAGNARFKYTKLIASNWGGE